MEAGHDVREVRPEEYDALGELLVRAYRALPGMPQPDVAPAYYRRLRDVGRRARNRAIKVFVAVTEAGELLGSVDFIEDLNQYNAGVELGERPESVGIRLLAVAPEAQGRGLGKTLTQFCLERARELGKRSVLLHTTKVMTSAWRMYERFGFERYPEIDFRQGELDVFGFRLAL